MENLLVKIIFLFRQKIRTISQKQVYFTFLEMLFCSVGDVSFLPNVSTAKKALALTGFILAARVILRKWKSQDCPVYKEWVTSMTDIASFELLVAKLHNCKKSYFSTWEAFLSSLKS